jgi:hypothetical protein
MRNCDYLPTLVSYNGLLSQDSAITFPQLFDIINALLPRPRSEADTECQGLDDMLNVDIVVSRANWVGINLKDFPTMQSVKELIQEGW